MKLRRIRALGWALLLGATLAWPVHANTLHGKLSGLVVDPLGVPQMGASVSLVAETGRSATPLQLLTNDRGIFSLDRVRPGLYTVRVTLAGFLPTLEKHVRIDPNLTTILRIELDSVFSSLDRLRRQPNQPTDADDFGWVLRASAGTRPVLRFADGEVADDSAQTQAERSRKRGSRGRLELTSGSNRPGSVSNLVDAPATAFAYDQSLGRVSRLVFAGQASYERSSSAGFATLWLPSGDAANGPRTTLVLRRSQLGPGGPTFRGARMDHSNSLTLGEHITLRYGAEYLLVGLGHSTSSLRPRGELTVRFSPEWQASLTVAPRPFSALELQAGTLSNALLALDAFPAVMLRDRRPVIEGGWHDELAVERQLGPNAQLVASVFRDRSRHTAIFGRGASLNPDFFQDFFSHSFIYDGGASDAWGTRVAYRQKFSGDLEGAIIYAWGGALAPELTALSGEEMRDVLMTQHRHSMAARFWGRVPRWGTVVTTSYKWTRGRVVSRQDPFGEALYQLDPYFNVKLRQPLPSFFFPGRVEALADFRNLLAQGYVQVSTPDGRILLVPSARTFRGGLSFQF